MKCRKKFSLFFRQDSWNKLISWLKSSTAIAQTLFAKLSVGTSMDLSADKILSCAMVIALAWASSSPCQSQEQHQILSLVKTERVWKPRKWHLTEKHWFYKVEGKDEPVMLLRKIKGVRSDIKRKIDWHSCINTACTLLITGLQVYQSSRTGN